MLYCSVRALLLLLLLLLLFFFFCLTSFFFIFSFISSSGERRLRVSLRRRHVGGKDRGPGQVLLQNKLSAHPSRWKITWSQNRERWGTAKSSVFRHKISLSSKIHCVKKNGVFDVKYKRSEIWYFSAGCFVKNIMRQSWTHRQTCWISQNGY